MIEVVFFDAGETILHPHPSFPELFAEVCRRSGHRVSPAEVERVQARLAPHLVDLAEETGIESPSLSAVKSRAFWSHLYRRFLTELGLDDDALVTSLYETFSSSASYRLFDDVLPTLRRLQDGGYRLGLISNFEAWLQEMLVELEVGHLFDITVISGVAGVEKPDPAIYRHAVAEAGVKPEAAAHVGDSIALDIEPAATVGLHPILLDRAGRYEAAPCPRIGTLEELPGLLDTLRSSV